MCVWLRVWLRVFAFVYELRMEGIACLLISACVSAPVCLYLYAFLSLSHLSSVSPFLSFVSFFLGISPSPFSLSLACKQHTHTCTHVFSLSLSLSPSRFLFLSLSQLAIMRWLGLIESLHTCECVTSHVWMSHVTHLWMSHVSHLNGSCHTSEWVTSRIWMSHVTHLNDSCHTSEWVMSHIWMIHVTHPNEWCYTHECVMSHKNTDRKELAMGLFGLEIWLHPKELQTLLDILDEVFTCVTDMSVTHDYSFKCSIWLIHTCDVTYSYE